MQVQRRCLTCPLNPNRISREEFDPYAQQDTDCPTGQPVMMMNPTGQVDVLPNGVEVQYFSETPACVEDLSPELLAAALMVQRAAMDPNSEF